MSEDKSSKITRRFKQTGDLLQGGAEKQVAGYKTRFDKLSGIYDKFLSKLIVAYPDGKAPVEFVDKFFGKRNLVFGGIDGTVFKQDVFDLIIFFAGAYCSEGVISVDSSGTLSVKYDEAFLEKGLGVSSVLPLFVNEVPLVDQTVLVRAEDGSVDDTITQNDSWIIDNSAFADYLMTLSEFYLAYRLVSREEPVDILLIDRIFSSEIASSYAETSEFRVDLEKECGLIGQDIDGRPFTTTEWVYARRIIGSLDLGTPPARGEYLLPRIIEELLAESGGGLTRQELTERLDLNSESRLARLDKELESGMKTRGLVEGMITRKGTYFSIKPRYKDIKERIKKLVEQTCGKIFSEDPKINYEARFKVGDRWITTNDLSFLALMCLYLTIQKCREQNILLVGVAKDTSARDLKRQVIPVLNYVGLFQGGFGKEEDTPDTDRMMLQWVSLKERARLQVPWATCEYDTAFKTIVPHFEGAKGLVSGARRNQISLEKTFVKAYFQLSEACSDPKLRSNVLLYDRLVYTGFDSDGDQIIRLRHDYEHKPDQPEPVEVLLYRGIDNPIQQFIMASFKVMTSMSIPELFGHLKPLYVADKIAKYNFKQFSMMVESTAKWLINRPELREFLFYLSTFRERRSAVEQSRRFS
ncbi:MAG: hypothetical protein EAX95_15015 [Candidatus Thorarchaeota archaeon]|nr:hypothetical protein [Candidatus Thorarchaeota archaeon]